MADRYVVKYNKKLKEYYIKDNMLNVMFYLTDKYDVENIANLLNKSNKKLELFKENLEMGVEI